MFKDGEEKGTAPHWSQERKAASPPGSQTRQPNRNRDFTMLVPRDAPAATTPARKA